jgi:hypothetical protein
MQGLVNNYSRAQIANLPKKRKKLHNIITRLKNKSLRPETKVQLTREAHRLLKYTTKGASF